MQNPIQTVFVGARLLLLLAVVVSCMPLLRPPMYAGAKLVVASRLIPARPAEWPDSVAGRTRFDTFVEDGIGVPAALSRPGELPLRWTVEGVPGARLRLGYRLRPPGGGEPKGKAPSSAAAPPVGVVAITWQGRSGERTELLRYEVGEAERHTAQHVDVALPEGAGEILLEFAAGPANSPGEELLWLDPLVLAPSATPPPNVIIVCIDTLRADRFAVIGGGATALPLTEKRLASAAVFRQAYSNAPWTLPSVATVITGLYPGLHNAGRRTPLGKTQGRPTNYSATPTEGGIQLTIAGNDYRFQMLHPSVPTLHALLGERGYVTGAIFRNGYLNHPTRVFLGADSFHHYVGHAPEGADLAIGWLRRHAGQSFYLFLHFIDPHQWPRRIPRELQGLHPREFGEAEKAVVWQTYDDLAAQADEHLDRVFRTLARLRLLDDTYVILLADHGERFFEKGVRGSHGGDHYESVLRVPLAVWGPEIEPRRIDSRVSLADVTPTVLDLLGIDTGEIFSGSSLRPLLDGDGDRGDRPILSEFVLWNDAQTALLRDGWKYIRREGREELYYLPEDPSESHNRAPSDLETLARLRREVERKVAEADRRFTSLRYGETQLDPGTVGSLKALGYLE